FIEETIRSVLLQGYPDLEYIIMDGGSTDNTVEIIKKYAHWLAHWSSEKDEGQAKAINEGFTKARGSILGYLNSDDIYCNGGLAALLEHNRRRCRYRRRIFAGRVQDFPESISQRCHNNSEFGRIDQWLDGGIGLHQPGCLWTSDLWRAAGPFREDTDFVFDRYFFSKCRMNGAKLISTRNVTAGFRLHDESKTTNNFLNRNRFSLEWEAVKRDLEAGLSGTQRVTLKLRRETKENWELVSQALSAQYGAASRKPLYKKLRRNPFWLMHRPVAGAVIRLITSAIKNRTKELQTHRRIP
ncbi:MAG: glycosyltransferase, partial [Pseudomonadota bacterium]